MERSQDMANAAERFYGYNIIDINITAKEGMMKHVSWEIEKGLMRIEDYKYVITNLLACPPMEKHQLQILWNQSVIFIRNMKSVWTFITTVTSLSFITFISRHKQKIIIGFISSSYLALCSWPPIFVQ